MFADGLAEKPGEYELQIDNGSFVWMEDWSWFGKSDCDGMGIDKWHQKVARLSARVRARYQTDWMQKLKHVVVFKSSCIVNSYLFHEFSICGSS